MTHSEETVGDTKTNQERNRRYALVREAADFLQVRGKFRPKVAIVLGTGLGGVADSLQNRVSVDYADIPNFPQVTVLGHNGRLVFGVLHGVPTVAMQGRFHLYEGYSPQQVVLPIRVLHLLGADILLATNAAGGVNPTYKPGTFMLFRDSIGIPMLAGQNPLLGPNVTEFGERFHPMAGAYDYQLRQFALEAAKDHDIAMLEGTYAMVTGPSFESQAELRFLRVIGADAVGMSTIPEVIAARHMKMRVLAISCITNATPQEGEVLPPDGAALHDEVTAVATKYGPPLASIIDGVVARLARVVASNL